MTAIEGGRDVVICGDNAAIPSPARYRLTGCNYLINGDALRSRALVIRRCKSGLQSSIRCSKVLKHH